MRTEYDSQASRNGTGAVLGIAYLLTFFLSNASLNPIDDLTWSIFTRGKPYPDAATFYTSTIVAYALSLLASSLLISSLLRRLPMMKRKIHVGKSAKAFQLVGVAVPILLPIVYFGFLWDRHDIEEAFGMLIYIRRSWAAIGAILAGVGLLLAACNTVFEFRISVRPWPRLVGGTIEGG